MINFRLYLMATAILVLGACSNITNDTIRFKNMLVTEMACDNMTVEQDLLRLFNDSTAYAIYSGQDTACSIYFNAPVVGAANFSKVDDQKKQ